MRAVIKCFVERIKRYDGISTDARQGRKGFFSLVVKFYCQTWAWKRGALEGRHVRLHCTSMRTSQCWRASGDCVCDSCSRGECDCLNDEPGVTAVEGRVVIVAGLLRELKHKE